MRRSTRKEVKNLIRQHIKDSVYDYECSPFDSFEGAAKHLAEEFNRVANYENNRRRIPNEQERFKDYLHGLPFEFEFEYYRQRETLNEWLQTEDDSKYSDREVSDRYYALIYREVQSFIREAK